jgi:catechol 2,3-dioxygenase-like lactoylglutathione lyase family enzyme
MLPKSLDRILETAIYADDLTEADRFYGEILGLECIARVDGRHLFYRCGGGVLLVFNPRATMEPSDSSVPRHGMRGEGHVAFAVNDEDLAAWRSHLRAHAIEIESEVTWPRGGRSLYVRDPAGNSVELASPTIWGFAR